MNDEQIKELSYDILSKLILIPRKSHYSMMEAAIKEALKLEREKIVAMFMKDRDYSSQQREEIADKIRKGEHDG